MSFGYTYVSAEAFLTNENMSSVKSLRTAFPIFFFCAILCELQLPGIVDGLVCICQKGMREHSKQGD